MTRVSLMHVSVVGCLSILCVSATDVVADEQPENATSRFLGAEADRAGVSFVLQQSSPLFGGREYYISGAGRIVDPSRTRCPAHVKTI